MQVFESFEATVQKLETNNASLERDFISLREKVLQDFRQNTELNKLVTEDYKSKITELGKTNALVLDYVNKCSDNLRDNFEGITEQLQADIKELLNTLLRIEE